MKINRGTLYTLYLALARASLAWEYIWPAFWPAVGLAGLFSAAALLDLFSFLPVWLHAAIVILFLIAFFGALQRGVTRFPRIRHSQARHRVEVDSGLDHRPLEALDDQLAAGAGDPGTALLWDAHVKRMQAEAREIRLKLPKPGLGKHDPWAFRAALGVLLVVGVLSAGSESFSRLGRALIPELNALALGRSVKLNLWVTPPAYTGQPPIVVRLGGAEDEPGADTKAAKREQAFIDVPVGSTVLAQVSGGGAVPELLVDDAPRPFGRIEADTYHLETTLTDGKKMSVVQRGRSLAAWELNIRPDLAPKIEFSAAAETGQRLRLKLPYKAEDDYGLKEASVSIRRIDGVSIAGGESEIILRLPLPAGNRKSVKGKSNHDLVPHVWAGLPVFIHLTVTDDKGQTGISIVEPAVLPERNFTHPIAAEIYKIRKGLSARERDRRLGILKIDQITDEVERTGKNHTLYLALRVARERLRQDKRDRAVFDVQNILWDMALGLEEGRAADAGRDLAKAQQALKEALARNADIKELERLMNEVQKALQRFMSSLAEELERRGQLPQMDPNAKTTDMAELQKLLDRARELMRQGSREAAEQLMAELQRMLENLRGALAERGQMSKESRQAQKSMREMREIIRRQQKLLDDTYKRTQPGGQPRENEQRNETNSDGLSEQEAIRRELGKLMRKFGDQVGRIPKGLGEAERSMRKSERALGQGRPRDSIDPQSQALDSLRRGAQNSARALALRMGRGRGAGRSGPRGGQFGRFTGPRLKGLRPGNRDPFGRQLDEGSTGTASGSVKIPGESEVQRARQILDELRKRMGDLWRPEMELEYIERLLKRV
ncbi:MAG: DUF4175 domain-containing protein [Rhodospirillales bacterium]|nr:DUF4175 domain-containing protein [Rhodospirillales bacterium]